MGYSIVSPSYNANGYLKAGTYTINATLTANANYAETLNGTTLTVTPAPMVISATGDGGYYIDGLTAGDTQSSVLGTTLPVVQLNSGTYSVTNQTDLKPLLVNYTPLYESATAIGSTPVSPPVLGIAGSGYIGGGSGGNADLEIGIGANLPVPTVGIDWGFVLDKATGRFKLVTV